MATRADEGTVSMEPRAKDLLRQRAMSLQQMAAYGGRKAVGNWTIPLALGALTSGVAVVLAVDGTVPRTVSYGIPSMVLLVIVASWQTHLRARARYAHSAVARLRYEMCVLAEHHLAIVRVQKLFERLDREERMLIQRLLRNVGFTLLVAFPLLAAAVVLEDPNALMPALIAGSIFELLAVLFFSAGRIRARQLESAVQRADYELNLFVPDLPREAIAERLYFKQQFELERYHDEALRQSSSLLVVGIGCVIGGFAIVGATFGLLMQDGVDALPTAVIGGIGGILANFVAAVFLQMHSSTVKALTAFHDRLVGTNDMHLEHIMTFRAGNDGRADRE